MRRYLFLVFGLTLLPFGSLQAATAFTCGVTDGVKIDQFTGSNVRKLKAFTADYCRRNSSTGRCGVVVCRSFAVDRGYPVGSEIRRTARRSQGRGYGGGRFSRDTESQRSGMKNAGDAADGIYERIGPRRQWDGSIR